MSMLTLFRCSTLEDWSDVLYINIFGCVNYGYSDEMNASRWRCNKEDSGHINFATFYFTSFIVLGALVLLTLFVGVVTTSMEEATLRLDQKNLVDLAVEKAATENNISSVLVDIYREIFDLLDLDGGGTVEIEEFKVCLNAVGIRTSEKLLDAIMQDVDESGDGELNFSEFLSLMMLLKEKRQAATQNK